MLQDQTDRNGLPLSLSDTIMYPYYALAEKYRLSV